MKNTFELQLGSVRAFARELGFVLETRSDGHMFFTNQTRKVKMQKMIEYHNGTLARIGTWHSINDIMWQLSSELGLGLRFDQNDRIEEWSKRTEKAFAARYVKQAKIQWSAKSKKFKPMLQYDNIIKVNESVDLAMLKEVYGFVPTTI